MSSLGVILSSVALLSYAQTTASPLEKKLVGYWEAVKITDRKTAPKDRAGFEKAAIPWNNVHLLSSHQFKAMFTIPLDGTWSVKGSKVVLKVKVMNDVPSKNTSGTSFIFRPDPIELLLDKDGKSMTRVFEGETIVFKRKGT